MIGFCFDIIYGNAPVVYVNFPIISRYFLVVIRMEMQAYDNKFFFLINVQTIFLSVKIF